MGPLFIPLLSHVISPLAPNSRTRNQEKTTCKLQGSPSSSPPIAASIFGFPRTFRVPADLPEGPAEVIVLVAPKPKATQRDKRAMLGMDRGKVHIADDFDAPPPDEVQRAFDGDT